MFNIETIIENSDSRIITLPFAFKDWIELFAEKEDLFKELVEIAKKLSHISDWIKNYEKYEKNSLIKAKNAISKSVNSIEIPPRSKAEKAFEDIFKDIWILLRLHWKICTKLFWRPMGDPKKIIACIEELFGNNSPEFEIISNVNDFLKLLWDIRWEIEHPKWNYEFKWIQFTEEKNIILPSVRYKDIFINTNHLIKCINDFIVSHTEFLIVSWIHYKMWNECHLTNLRYIPSNKENDKWTFWNLLMISPPQ